jgi:hypothetical protein
VKATTRILFWETSATWSTDFASFDAGQDVKLLGYDTLADKIWRVPESPVKKPDYGSTQHMKRMKSVQKDVERLVSYSENQAGRVAQVLGNNGVRSGSYLTFKQCEDLCELGVVVELLLLPMARIREVMQWQIYDNII